MYYCTDCKETFEILKQTAILHTEVDTRREEPVLLCPICGSDDIERMKKCLCGEWIRSYEDYCQGCIKERDKAIKEAVERLKEAYGIGYKNALEFLVSGLEE